MGNSNTSARYQAKLADREAKALDLFVGGATYARIAEAVGYSDGATACRAVQRAARRRRDERDELADVALTLMLDRLDALFRAHIVAALDRNNPNQYRATEAVLRVMDRMARLQGLDAPVQVEATVRVKDELDDEIATLVGMLKAAGPADALPATPVLDSIVDAEIDREDHDG